MSRPARRKSNQPEFGRRQPLWGKLIHGKTLPHSGWEEYQRIRIRAFHIYMAKGRRAAVEYLQGSRAWLVAYHGYTYNFPASGELLDGIIREIQLRLKS
jgi:hypothetical protein